MKNLNEVEVGEGYVSKYMEPGIHEVVIASVEGVELGANKSLAIKVTVQDEEGKSCEQAFWMNDVVGEGKEKSAQDVSLPQLRKIVKECGQDGAWNSLSPTMTDNTAYTLSLGTQLNTLLVGKKMNIVLWGKVNTYSKDGAIITNIKAVFGGGNFCEAIGVIPSTLKFDKSNPKHLPVIPQVVSNEQTTTPKVGW